METNLLAKATLQSNEQPAPTDDIHDPRTDTSAAANRMWKLVAFAGAALLMVSFCEARFPKVLDCLTPLGLHLDILHSLARDILLSCRYLSCLVLIVAFQTGWRGSSDCQDSSLDSIECHASQVKSCAILVLRPAVIAALVVTLCEVPLLQDIGGLGRMSEAYRLFFLFHIPLTYLLMEATIWIVFRGWHWSKSAIAVLLALSSFWAVAYIATSNRNLAPAVIRGDIGGMGFGLDLTFLGAAAAYTFCYIILRLTNQRRLQALGNTPRTPQNE